MTISEVPPPFTKSSYCGTDACVEVALVPGQPLIRDAKEDDGPVLAVSPAAWRSFVQSLR